MVIIYLLYSYSYLLKLLTSIGLRNETFAIEYIIGN